jgi:hypothetical protein
LKAGRERVGEHIWSARPWPPLQQWLDISSMCGIGNISKGEDLRFLISDFCACFEFEAALKSKI